MLTFPAMLTKKALYELVGGGPTAVAAIFNLTKSAISQWPDPIPDDRYFELKGRRPDLFPAEPGDLASPPQPLQEAA